MRRDRGFTLIELVLVMIVISVGLVGLTSLFSNSATSLSTNEALQQATQYAQECAEKVLGTRRNLGYTSAVSGVTAGTICPPPSGFTVDTVTGSTSIANGTTPCPSLSGTGGCEKVVVTAAASPPNANLNSSITVMLVNY